MWDRFDDVMDDMHDDVQEMQARCERLCARLRELGVAPPPAPIEDPAPSAAQDAGDYMNAAYHSYTGFWTEMQAYHKQLQQLVTDAEAAAAPKKKTTKAKSKKKQRKA
ncbi:MAG: hypothetical protein AB7K09_15920 [Planctomycetota bacterium]